jgi:diacylglycerol kinase
MFQKTLNSFRFAVHGLTTVWREEYNFRIEVLCAVVVLLFACYFQFTFVESALCIFAVVLVLTAEIVNTAVEDVCNKIESNHDPVIGKIKDVMSGFVLVSVVGAVIVGGLVAWHHFL